ncbi:hypothetical protein ABIE26_003049 [Pedobacter africanus]|uniref:Uncharacterized protein n=1 Tax=Pedobacter africanus TaxID=151894 RepID=A0ACC6KWT6_9SPHI|nr:hypothetical protein [Pedobacter africanus]MDR6783632.1 hypothetical protein [Pedobacter africanus]
MKSWITGLLLCVVSFANAQEVIKSRKVSKSFTVGRNDRVTVNNQYGALDIRTWDKNEVRIEVDLKVYGDNTAEAQELLDLTNIKAMSAGGEVILDTKLAKGKVKTGKKWKAEIKGSYQVYMPVTNSLNLSHQYGDVSIGDLSGALEANVQYGNLKTGNLKSASNKIKIQYGSADIRNVNQAEIVQQYGAGLTIGSVGTLKLNAAYAAVKIGSVTEKASITQQYGSGLTIGSAHDLDLNAAYAKVSIGMISGAANIVQRYSNLTIGTAGNLITNTQYANVTISKLRGDSKFTMQYNNLNIGDVSTECQKLEIDCAHLKATVNLNVNYNAVLEVNTNAADFKYGPGISVKTEGAGQNKRYTGKIGSGGNSKVTVNSKYGGVTLN